MSKKLSVHVIQDGPLKISGAQTAIQYCGEAVPTQAGDDVYICRCGESQKPPFCDGSHSKAGFVGSSEEGRKHEIKVWRGKTINTYFNPNACMHVFYCKPLKELRQRELEGDASAALEIAKVVRSCPSGALRYEAADVSLQEEAQPVEVDIMEGGEVRIQCEFEINADLQEGQSSDRATLCRCGQSKNKPWCDGLHKKREGFR